MLIRRQPEAANWIAWSLQCSHPLWPFCLLPWHDTARRPSPDVSPSFLDFPAKLEEINLVLYKWCILFAQKKRDEDR
jgi:hypothetical protein